MEERFTLSPSIKNTHNTQISKNIRSNVKTGTSVAAKVVDVFVGRASVRLVQNGALIRNLEVVGGPVKIGDSVKVDFTTARPTVVVVGQKGITHQNVMDMVTGQDPDAWHKVTYPPLQAGGGEGGGHIIEDEGIALAQRKYLDFIGPYVLAEDDEVNGKTTVTITSGPLVLYHNGIYVGTVTGLNFEDDDCS